jgi:hypothetical protein
VKSLFDQRCVGIIHLHSFNQGELERTKIYF